MAMLFSAVKVTAKDQEVDFLVGGIPREYEDLDEEMKVAIHAEAYLYGEEETHRANNLWHRTYEA